jgi:formate--tetrahydrofolate ligase
MGLFEKIETIAKRIYHADEVIADKSIRDQLRTGRRRATASAGLHGQDAVFLLDRSEPARRADRHTVPIREVRLSAGAGFVVVICGEIMTMPGLPRSPAAETIRINEAGFVEGLF